MPSFGKKSRIERDSCEEELIIVLDYAIQHVDFSVICGHRDMEEQNKAFNEGNSQLRYPNSNHNKWPARAVDIIPYPSGWDNLDKFNELSTYMYEGAIKYGVLIRWGGHWKNYTGQGDDDRDWAHWELY